MEANDAIGLRVRDPSSELTPRDFYAAAVAIGMLARNNGIDAQRVFALADEMLSVRTTGGSTNETNSASE